MLSNQCFHFESTNYNDTLERKPPVNMKKRRGGEIAKALVTHTKYCSGNNPMKSSYCIYLSVASLFQKKRKEEQREWHCIGPKGEQMKTFQTQTKASKQTKRCNNAKRKHYPTFPYHLIQSSQPYSNHTSTNREKKILQIFLSFEDPKILYPLFGLGIHDL